SRVDSYQKLAGKAVRTGDSSDGVAAALERFFHKLEFLLKEGYLPEGKDVNGDRLPAELQGLKDFLNNPSREIGEAYYLQRNKAEGYRFIWQENLKLTVNRETLYAPVTAVRSGYTGADTWRTETITQNVKADSVLQALNGNQETEKTSLSGPAQTQP
ncbi:TPA: hypothetical protein ACP62B_004861, partial [Escherichia coli]